MTAFKEGSIDRWMHARMLGGMPVWELSCYPSSPIPPEALRMKDPEQMEDTVIIYLNCLKFAYH